MHKSILFQAETVLLATRIHTNAKNRLKFPLMLIMYTRHYERRCAEEMLQAHT